MYPNLSIILVISICLAQLRAGLATTQVNTTTEIISYIKSIRSAIYAPDAINTDTSTTTCEDSKVIPELNKHGYNGTLACNLM